MASGGSEEDDGSIPLDIDNVHMLLQVEHEQIQRRTFTNWINAQLSKRCPPSFVSDLFSDLRDGSQLLNLLEVMSGQPMKRQRGRGVFQQRADIETALNFLKRKSIKLVNINISDIIDGRPSIILGLIWTIILHCHIEELASTLSFSSCHSSLDSLTSLDSWSGSPVPASPVPAGRTSPLHRRFRVSAKKALLMWVRDQCQRVGCSVSVRDFKSSWRSGEAFLAILCSLRPQLVDLSLVQSRSNQENLEEAFHLAERELHIPRLLEPQDVDVKDPDEKSIMTYVAQFLQYSNDMPAPDDHLQIFPLVQPFSLSAVNLPAHFTPAIAVSPLRQVSPSERALEVTCWLQQAYQELSEAWTATEKSSFAERYQVFQSLADTFTEQRKPVMTLLAAIRRRPELSQEQCVLKTAWDRLEEELQRRKADLDSSLPPPLDSVVVWLQRAEAALTEEGGRVNDHSDAAKEARSQQDTLKTLIKEMSHHINILDTYNNTDESGNIVVPLEKFDEIKRRLTNIRVTAKYQGIQLEYQESRHTVLDLLGRINAKVQTWKAPYRSKEKVLVLLQDWHETVERQGLILILMEALQNLKEKANAYTSKAALDEGLQRVTRQVKEAESETELLTQAVSAVKGTMERVVSAWETYNSCIASLQTWLAQKIQSVQFPAAGMQDMSEWTSCQAKLNEAGNLLIELTESSTSLTLAEQLSKVNMQWAEYMKRTMFEASSEPSVSPLCLQMVHSLTQEANLLLRQPLEVTSAPLKACRQKLQLLSKKMADVDLSSLSSSTDFQTSHIQNLQQTLPQMLTEAERTCGVLQRAASTLEGRLAELDRWSTEALDCQQQIKEKKHRGHSALEPTAKVLVSRGLQLESQVVTEGRALQDLVVQLEKTSPLQHLSTSSLQNRISEAVSYCQEILGMFSSFGYVRHVETARQPEAGLFVVAKTKHVDQVGNIMLQPQDQNQVLPESPAQTPQQRTKGLQGLPTSQHTNTQDEPTIVTPRVQIKMQPQPLRERVSHIQTSPAQTVKEAESKLTIQLQSSFKPHAQASSPSQNVHFLPALTKVPVGPKCAKNPALSKGVTSPVPEEKEAPTSQTSKSKIKGILVTPQGDKTPPRPPVMVRSEVHSKAQSMARSRLEKARFRLQGRIQQAIKLFSGKEISESQAKKKQKALKILQPAVLEEFLVAVEGYGAFCTGPQLQDLMLLSDSVRKQWEDVRREMAALVPILWSKIRERRQCFSVVQCETQTNTLHEATDQTDHDSLLQLQAVMDGAATAEEHVESLQELCETLTPAKTSCLATDQLRESDEVQEPQPSDKVLPSDSRGWQLQGNTPLRATGMLADTQQSNSLKQSVDSPQQDVRSVQSAVSVQPRGEILHVPAQDASAESEDDSTRRGGCGPGRDLKPSLRAKEQRLKARVLHITDSSQQSQTHMQAVVWGDTVETKQEAEWTVIAEAAAPAQEEHSSLQEALERYRKSCSKFQSQLQKNKQHLEEFISNPGTVSSLQNQNKQLQTLKQETEALWFEFELQYAQLSRFSHLMSRDNKADVERDRQQLTQQWRSQQKCLQSRMTSVENTADLLSSADNQMALTSEKLNQILGKSIDISSFTLADPKLLSDLKDKDDGLRSEIRKLSQRGTEEERQGSKATSPSPLCVALHNSVHHLEQLRQQLEKVQLAAQALDHFLTAVRETKAEIPKLLANQDPSRQQNEADWEQERQSWQAAVQQKLQTAVEQSDGVDSTLNAVGMTLTMDGATVTCRDVVTSLSQQALDVEKELIRARKRERKDELFQIGKEQIENEELSHMEICQTKTGNDSTQKQELPTQSRMEEESEMEAKRSRLEEDYYTKTQMEDEHKAQTWVSEEDALKAKDQKQRSSQVKKEGEEKESLVQRRAALLSTLREIKGSAEQLGLQEPTLPALQQRTRTLTELERRLAGHLSELQHIQDASSRLGIPDVSETREVEDVWEEATKAVAERLEQCNVLTELLKRFQSIRGELSGTLQRAESTISEQASYMGKDNLHRRHTMVQETKALLNSLGDGIEEVRSVCRQLHTQLRQIPGCTINPFESEADSLMDSWLDISERTDSHIENLHLSLTLWDGLLQLGAEVESWTTDKVAVFAQSPSFQTEEDISTLQNEIMAQEKSTELFHRRATEIQTLLQSTESPLELQVVETQMKKKIEQLKELVSEAEDVYRQTVAAKGQITARMAECFKSLQKIQESLLTLSGSDVAEVLAELKELLFELQAQDEQAESLLEDLRVMASIVKSSCLQSLSEDGIQLQDKVRNIHQLFSEVEEQTERNIQALDRLQRESEHLEQWLQTAEERAAKEEDLTFLREEALQQRLKVEAISQLASSLQSSTLRQSALLEESSKLLEQYNHLQNKILHGSVEKQSSRQVVESPLGKELGIPGPVELHSSQGVCSRLEEGVCNEEHFGQLLQDCHRKLTSLQERMSARQTQEEGTAGQVTDVAALEALLQEVTDMEKDLLQIITLKDSITSSSTAEAKASLSQQVSNLQNHKRALESSIREKIALLTENRERDLDKEASCVETELKNLAKGFENLCENSEESPNISQLKQQWLKIQDFNTKLTQLAAKVTDMQKTGESCSTQGELSAGFISTVDAVAKDLESLRSIFLQKKQEFAENTANTIRQVISQLQEWSQTVQAEASSPSQEVLNEGSCRQQALREILSEQDFFRQCLGAKVMKKLQKRASDTLNKSTPALETLSKSLASQVSQSQSKEELEEVVEATGRESDASDLASPDKAPPTCPAPSFHSATDSMENSESEKKDNKIKTKGTLETSREDTLVSDQSSCVDNFKSQTQEESQHFTSYPPNINSNTCLKPKDDTSTLNTESNLLTNGHKALFESNPEPLMPDCHPTLNKSLAAWQESTESSQEDTTSTQESNLSAVGTDNHKEITSAQCFASAVGNSTTKQDTIRLSTPENVSELLLAQSETLKAFTDAEEQEKCFGDFSETPKKVFTIVLDIDLPEFKPQHIQQRENTEANRPDLLTYSQEEELHDSKLADVSNTEFPEKMSGLITTIISPKSDEKDLKNLGLKSVSLNALQVADSVSENPSASVSTELEEVKSTSAKLLCEENSEANKLMKNDVHTSSESTGAPAECQLTGALAADTTFQDAEQEEMTDFCHAEEQTLSSVLCNVEGEPPAETQKPASDNIQLTAADAAKSTGTEHLEKAERENTEDTESKLSKVPERRDKALLPTEETERKVAAPMKDTEVTQRQFEESMEPERTVPGLAVKTGGGSPETYKHESSMQDILSEIQNLVEKSNIINRSPHIDLNWYLNSSPGETEIRLVRTVQRVLACRYQPAQLNVTTMVKQLQEAEAYRSSVQEQVAAMKSMSAAETCDPDHLKSVEGQCSAALLDASATVQVKAAQLDQVKQYHKQMKIMRAFLEVLATEKDKMSLNTLGSSAVQAEKLRALLQTMVQKKHMMEELLQLSSQLSAHLSDAESSGALLAQLGDVQEEWRLLEGSIKRALQHASNSTSQYSVLIKEAERLKAKLEALQMSGFQNVDSKCTLELVCLTIDLKLYNQLYLHLQSQSDALVNFSLGQKETDKIKHSLRELGSLLNVTKSKLDTFSYSCGISSAKINKQLHDLIIWAKQAENHISIGKKLALFPEEARIQIVEMKKFQADVYSRRSKLHVDIEQMKDLASAVDQEERDQILKTTEDLYEAITESLDHVLDTMKKNLQEREKVLCQLASMDVWLAETHAKRDPCAHVDNISKADIRKLESELKSHKIATVEIESQLKLVEALTESCREVAAGLSPGESRYLVNRLSGLWTELDGLLAHEKATSWELEELIHERTSSDEELSTIQASLQEISTDLTKKNFPLTQETLSVISNFKHRLIEHQCEAQELQHCQEAKRSSLLCTIGELQDQCKTLSVNAFEQDKYLHLRRQMEESRDIAKEQIQRAKDKTLSVVERFKLCQTLLVELPLVKTQCQEAADQLEAIAQELYPSELASERQRIRRTVETVVSWEYAVTNDIKNLETKLLSGLSFSSELPALMEFFQRTRVELQGAKPVNPDEKALDIALRGNWVIWRNMEAGIRVLEGLGQKENIDLKNYKELCSLRDATKEECHLQMESLSQARESLKDYQWAAQGAIGFLHNAETTFLSAPGGFMDCTEEQRQTQQALEALEDGFQAHINHLGDLLPQQACLSHPKTEQLHINILSQLLVGRALLEAQAQLRLESLQRCEMRQKSHRKCHEDIRQHVSGLETQLSECAAEQVTSYDKCVAQQKRAQILMKDLRSLAGKIEELRAGCPMQGCGVGKDGELGALWRRWVSLRRGVGLLMAHTEQRGEEWKDITASMEQCCSFLASLQADVPDSSTMNFVQDEPQELLAQAEMHQAGLEQEQQALASLEHRLEHALSLSSSQDPNSPGPVGKTLVKIQENFRSLKERNLQVVAAAQAEEKERQQVQEEIGKVEQHLLAILPSLEAGSSDPCKQQELRKDFSFQKAKLKCIVDGVQSRYAEIPADISRRLQEVQLSLQREEEKLMESSNTVRKLNSQVVELGSGLEKVKELLEQRNPTVNAAQSVLKRVWDKLDAWHSRLMLLENEVQDLAEEHPDQAHLLMDQLTQPLQLYQNTAQMAEQRTTFLSKIPTCLQEIDGIMYSATCWLDEAQSWLSAPCSFTTARSLQNHANSLQLVLDDSERIRHALQDFRPVLDEISAVCDMRTQQKRLEQNDQQVHKMQDRILEPLEQLLQAVVVVEAMEAELKTLEKNVPKIEVILSSMENSNITLTEHLHNRQVILANMQSMRRTLEEMERCKGELHLTQGQEESLLVFSRAKLLLQSLEGLEQLTQQQVTQLENKIGAEVLDLASVSDTETEEIQQLDRSTLRQLVKQEAFEMSNSEEEEDEENESCHSSSSDTLTCSIPEDPEETLDSSDFQSENIAEIQPPLEVKPLKSLDGQISSEESSLKAAETEFNTKEPETVVSGLITMDSKDDVAKAFSPETVTAESQSTVAENPFIAAAETSDQRRSLESETLIPDPHQQPLQVAAAVEDTRMIPARPVTPFTATKASDDFPEDRNDLSLSTDLVICNVLKEHNEGITGQKSLVEESQKIQRSSEVLTSTTGHDEDDEEQLSWSQLYTQISQKLTTLKKVKEEHQTQIGSEDGGTNEKDPEKEWILTSSGSAVLQHTHESITMLRQIAKSADSSHVGVNEELYKAVRRVLLCLDALTDLLLSPGGASKDDVQLRLLQQECVSTELATLAELLDKVESKSRPAPSGEESGALCCLKSLQDCLHTIQPVFTSSQNQLIEHLGIESEHQKLELSSKQLCVLDEFELGQSETIPNKKDASLELCVLGRHLREIPGEKAKLQQASRSLLQGITRLLVLGEECITEGQMSQVHSRSQLQAALCRREKLLQVLRSQLAFVQHLFQREPEALECQEDERVQLEVRAKALQQRALEQEVASQRKIQDWTRWEDKCGRLNRQLDDLEALISGGEPEGDEEKLAQHQLDVCQQTLAQLDDSRAALGLLLDQGKVLQAEPEFAAIVSHAGGTLELRWQSAYRRTEQEIQRCRDIKDYRVRFQTDFESVSEWLIGAGKHLKTWSNVADTSDLNQECVSNHLIKLLDFSMETEGMSVKKASVSREAAQLLHLREADCPELRAQLAQLEVNWSKLTSDLSNIQERLQQRLVAAWPPVELLSDLEDWLKKLETRLSLEKETVLKVKDAAQVTEILQHYQELKAGVSNGQLVLDFLCQSGPRVVGSEVQAVRSEHTMFAEKLGALRLQWLHLQRELEIQIHEAEQMHHTCADRERQLRRLHGWIEKQKKQMNQRKHPVGQTLAHRALLDLESVVSKVSEAAAALQELKATRVHVGKRENHLCDVSFSGQTESVCQACGDLSQQLAVLKPALQQTVEEWGCLERDLREVSLHTTRVRCALQHQPLFSLKQAEGHMDLLQLLQEQIGKGEELWASVDKSCQSLVKLPHHGAAQTVNDQMEKERKRWKDVVQKLKEEHKKTTETLPLWQDYTQLTDRCSLHLQKLWLQWAELSKSSPQQDTQAVVSSMEQLQEAAEDLQSTMGDVLAASKPLIGRLEPQAVNLIQSETRLLSRDVLLLSQATSGKKKSLQEDLEQQEAFHTQLETLEKQILNMQSKLKASLNDTDSLKVLSELSGLFASLVDVSEMMGCVALNNNQIEWLHMLTRQWAENMTHMSDMNRELQTEHQRSQSLQEKCKNLTTLQKKLEEESASTKPQSYSSLKEMLTVHQRLENEIITGHQLLQALLCHAVESIAKETVEKRSELMDHVTSVRDGWFNTVALVGQRRSLIKDQLSQWRVYHRGMKMLQKLLRDVDPLLPPAGPAPCSLLQLQSCAENCQCVKDALGLHSAVFTQTLEAGRRLCETMTESECQSKLKLDLQTLEESWERTTSLLEKRRDLIDTTVQKWSQCQDRISSIMSELDELQTHLNQPLPERPQNSDDEKHIQDTELSLQRLDSGLKELATMKTDLSQYVAAGDSALLEQQLEQLHGQWEELCTKVSLRRQQIADRLNAWTIFNDKNKEFCDWLTQMENKVCHSGDLSIEEMVEKLKKDCMEEINLFSENKSHLKQLGEQLLLASDEAKQTQVHGSLLEVNQRWHNLFHHIEARVKKLKETLVTVQQLDKNMSNLRSWLSRMEAELSRPITYSVCHHQEIQRRLAEQQELQRDIEQHTEGVVSVLSLCDVLLRDEDAAGGIEAESDSLQETSRSLDQRWRTICAMALERRLRIEETWRLWCKFLDDYSRFEDWLKMAERTAANPNSADVLYTVAKEELKKFEGFQRQVNERLTQLELVNNQYRRLARENRTDRASQLKAMVHEGNRRWDGLHRRVAAVLRRLKYFTSQREEFEGTRESMLVWLTELDLQLTNVEHFSESDVHHKIQQLNSFQKEITLNTERIDGLIVFGEGLIQKSSPQDAALIEDELEELHSYCQEVFSRLVRFHQRLSQPPIKEEPELSGTTFSLESSLELIGRSLRGRGLGSLPATPTHLLASPLERSGRETPVSVDSLPLEWDHTGDVGGSSSHEDDEEEDEEDEERAYFSALSEGELPESQEEFFEAPEALRASSLVSSRSLAVHESPRWRSQGDADAQSLQLDSEGHTVAPPTLTSTPLKQGYLRLMSQCSGSIEDIKRVSLILDDEEQAEELGLTGLTASDKQSGVIERWELHRAQSRSDQLDGPQEPQQLTSDLDKITSWLENVIPELERHQQSEPAASIEDMEAKAKELKEMHKMFARYKSIMLSVNLRAQEAPELQDRLASMNQHWSRASTGLQQWDNNLRKMLMRCQEFHETLHSLLLWLAHADSRRYAVDIDNPDTPVRALQQHRNTLTDLQEELQGRLTQQASLQALWSQLQPEEGAEESAEAQEKLHVTGSKLKLLLRQVDRDLTTLQRRLDCETVAEAQGQSTSADPSQEAMETKNAPSAQREMRDASPPRSLFYRVLRAAFPLHLLLLFLLLLPCLIPMSESDPGCTGANNFARSFYPMLHYTNGPPPT